ncbi:MAG TPA: pinensin family lanthipeptide [Longimicrobium sp.]|nr:pinensin family lanthipeptide [Longimicrobium sp.]
MKLELDALSVESFVTASAPQNTGTVRARADLEEGETGDVAITAPITVTWAETCPATCRVTCPASCDTCYITCVTRCSCPTLPCDTCT